jgi:hypothetical protein
MLETNQSIKTEQVKQDTNGTMSFETALGYLVRAGYATENANTITLARYLSRGLISPANLRRQD